jgi:maltose 6'-phosphate phosphatase
LRLARLADFIATAPEPVDVILMQEVAGGLLEKTANVAVDLQRALAGRSLKYNLAYHLANGLPGVLSVGNAVLSRCKIALTFTWFLPFVTEEPFPNLNISVPLKREIMLARLDVPGPLDPWRRLQYGPELSRRPGGVQRRDRRRVD